MAITDKDVEKLKTVFVAKQDLRAELDRFATKDDLARVEGGIKNFRNEVMTGLGKVMGELEKAREDRIFAKAKDDEQDRHLDGLDKKVNKLEVKVGV